jgi:hypothetical protein
MLLKTSNGGTIWDTLPFMKQNAIDVEDIFFTTPTFGYAVDSYGNIYKTGDGAQTWQVDFPDDSVGINLNYVYINGSAGYATGYNGHLLKRDNLNSVNEIKNDFKISMFPNPTENGLVSILFNQTENVDLNVYNVNGQAMLTQNDFKSGQLNLSFLNNGMYYMHFTLSNR